MQIGALLYSWHWHGVFQGEVCSKGSVESIVPGWRSLPVTPGPVRLKPPLPKHVLRWARQLLRLALPTAIQQVSFPISTASCQEKKERVSSLCEAQEPCHKRNVWTPTTNTTQQYGKKQDNPQGPGMLALETGSFASEFFEQFPPQRRLY